MSHVGNQQTSEDYQVETCVSLSSIEDKLSCPNWADDVLKMDSPCVQNELTKCSTWTDGCVQVEQSITIDYTESTTENTLETSSSFKLTNAEEEKSLHFLILFKWIWKNRKQF